MPSFIKSNTSVQDFVILFRASFTAVLIALLAALGFSASTGCSGGPGGAGQASLAQSQRGTIYYLDDHLGSAQVVADAATGAIYEYAIYPYGLDGSSSTSTSTSTSTSDPTSTSAFESDYSYTTKERDDETGLIYFGRRYYSPDMGRWITPDPLFLEGPEHLPKMAGEYNLYSYVQNNPISYIDQNGEFACGGFCIAAAAVAAVSVKTAAVVKGVQYLTEYINDAQLGSMAGVNEGLAIGAAVPLGSVVLAGAGASVPTAFAAADALYESASFYGAMKTIEVASQVMSVDKFLQTYRMSEDFLSGYTRADAPSNWMEFVGSARGHGWAINERYGFFEMNNIEISDFYDRPVQLGGNFYIGVANEE